MARCPISKSTKRRRFLEELEVDLDESEVQFQSTSKIDAHHEISNSDSFKPFTTPIIASCSSISNVNDGINDSQLPIISFFDRDISISPVTDEYKFKFNSDSDTDSDKESISNQNPFFNHDNKQLMLNLIAQWAVTHNISNTAFS